MTHASQIRKAVHEYQFHRIKNNLPSLQSKGPLSAVIHFSSLRRGRGKANFTAGIDDATSTMMDDGVQVGLMGNHSSGSLEGSPLESGVGGAFGGADEGDNEEQEWAIDDDSAIDNLAQGKEEAGVVQHHRSLMIARDSAAVGLQKLGSSSRATGDSAPLGHLRLGPDQSHLRGQHRRMLLEDGHEDATDETSPSGDEGSSSGVVGDSSEDGSQGGNVGSGSGEDVGTAASARSSSSVDQAIHHMDGLHRSLERMGACQVGV